MAWHAKWHARNMRYLGIARCNHNAKERVGFVSMLATDLTEHIFDHTQSGRVIAQQRRCALTAHQAHNSTHTHMAECRDAKHSYFNTPTQTVHTASIQSTQPRNTSSTHAATQGQDRGRARTTHACCGAGPWSAHQQPSRRWGSRPARAPSSREARAGSGVARRCASYGRA